MVVHIIALLFILFIAFINQVLPNFKGKKVIYCILLFAPLIILCSFKDSSVGNDTAGYLASYHEFKNATSLKSISSGFEKGFVIYSYLLAQMNMPFSIYLLITYSIIFLPFILLSYKYFEFPSIIALSLYLFSFYNFAISALRQSMGIGICFIGFYIFLRLRHKDNVWKYLKYVLLSAFIALSYFFHKSSLTFILIIPLYIFKDKIKINYLLAIPLLLLTSFLSPYLYSNLGAFSEKLAYLAPTSSFFLNLGNSTYFVFAIFSIATLISVNKKSYYYFNKINGLCSFQKSIISIDKASSSKCLDLSNFFYLGTFLYLFIICFSQAGKVFIRIAMFILPFVFFMAHDLFVKAKNYKFVFIVCYVGYVLLLIIYFYFATYKSNYLHLFPYSFDFIW